MPHNSPAHCDLLQKLAVYVPSPMFLKNTGWTQGELGHITVDKSTTAPLVAVAVSKVNGARLNCGPEGNFTPRFKTLEKAKFTFILDCQVNPPMLKIGTSCWRHWTKCKM